MSAAHECVTAAARKQRARAPTHDALLAAVRRTGLQVRGLTAVRRPCLSSQGTAATVTNASQPLRPGTGSRSSARTTTTCSVSRGRGGDAAGSGVRGGMVRVRSGGATEQ